MAPLVCFQLNIYTRVCVKIYLNVLLPPKLQEIFDDFCSKKPDIVVMHEASSPNEYIGSVNNGHYLQ